MRFEITFTIDAESREDATTFLNSAFHEAWRRGTVQEPSLVTLDDYRELPNEMFHEQEDD